MSRKKNVKELLVRDFSKVYDRIEYRDVPIPSCLSRRLLQESIDENYLHAFIGTYAHFVRAVEVHPERALILSEIVAIWFLTERGDELDAREKDAERRLNGAL